MKFTPSTLQGVYVIELDFKSDERGGFARVFCKEEFSQIKHSKEFVQSNQSWNTKSGTLRGLHYQMPPFREIKLVRCIKGCVMDVVVDLRRDSATFLKHVVVELSEENKRMIYIPEGFAHGFQTLTDHTELIYSHTEYYTPNAEGGLRYNDPTLGIKWPVPPVVISERDKNYPLINKEFKGI